jgi:pimeloyl-ACP methyl ester carboxylesterase
MCKSTGLILVAILSLLLVSCNMKKLGKEVEIFETGTDITGRVSFKNSGNPVFLLVIREDDGDARLVSYSVMFKKGEFKNFLLPGKYRYVAFEDLNDNYVYDFGEPAGDTDDGYFEVGGENIVEKILIEFDTVELKNVPDLSSKAVQSEVFANKVIIGDVHSLSEPQFSSEMGEKGLWEPLAFFKEVGGGIFPTYPLDSTKKPILFVHGAAGTPRDFEHIVAALDTSVYQPIMFYYPSGFRLEIVANFLRQLTRKLHLNYKMSDISIIAHSMGGLLTRKIINDMGRENGTKLNQYITISTPWEGHGAATMGVKYAPAVVPSWIDMCPESPLVETLFDTPLPEDSEYYLLFGVKGETGKYTGTNDGTVSIASQLRPEAQEQAIKIYGFDEGHMSILKSPRVIKTINEILAE